MIEQKFKKYHHNTITNNCENSIYIFCTDIIHEGHLNIINEALKLGEVIVGVLNDAASIRY